jgi:hypothetical protein
MVQVINEFGFASLKLTAEDFLKTEFVTQLGHKKMVNYEGVLIPFIGYNELLKVKAKAGRPQDIADISKLTKRNKGK